jgi:predicted  nucleic acid-binding Zn-ribbon protein
MTIETEVEALRSALTVYKQDLAKVIAGMQAGGERKQRRDLGRRLDACKRRARVLSREVDEVLAALGEDHEARSELETAAVFLVKVQDLGSAPAW